MAEILHIKVFRAGIGRMGFHAVTGEEDINHDDGGEHDCCYADTPREAVDKLMAKIENDALLRMWDHITVSQGEGAKPLRRKKRDG